LGSFAPLRGKKGATLKGTSMGFRVKGYILLEIAHYVGYLEYLEYLEYLGYLGYLCNVFKVYNVYKVSK
jgi:hypothetical protein